MSRIRRDPRDFVDSLEESPKVSMLLGGFPEVLARPAHANNWFRSYLQTCLERDVRAVSAIRDLLTFRRFLSLLATRHGQILNKTELAAPLGLSGARRFIQNPPCHLPRATASRPATTPATDHLTVLGAVCDASN